MKPLKLMMQAFGPYAGKEIIDFGQLENHTMFVISGRTGSGKTTIFDGISFAIYGRASSEGRTGAELRSHFASDDLLTEVMLQFSLKGHTYEIYRSPQQEKKKERGDGYRTVTAKAELYEWINDGERKLLAANVRDVDEKIKEIVQLDANQFRQILMIPQGEFRKLLVSDSKDKEQILQRLFHTQFYKKIEEKLKVEASSLKQKVQSGAEERTQLLKSIQSSSEEMVQLLQTSPLNESAVIIQLAKDIEDLTVQSQHIQQTLLKQNELRDEWNKKLDQAERLIIQIERKEQLDKQLQQLQARKEDILSKQTEIVWAEKATKLEQQEKECKALKSELDGLNQRINLTTKELAAKQEAYIQAEQIWKEENAKEEERQQAADEVSKLNGIKAAVYSLDDEQQLLERLEKEKQQLESCRMELSIKHEEAEKRIDQVEAELSSLDHWQNQLYQEEKKLTKVNERIQLCHDIQEQQTEVSNLQEQYRNLMKKYDEKSVQLTRAQTVLEELESAWNKHHASMLAATLVAGQPCAVCGSTDHPHPASEVLGAPAKEEIQLAKNEVERLESEQLIIEKNKFEKQTRYELSTETLGKLKQKAEEIGLDDDLMKDGQRIDGLLKQKQASEALVREANERLQLKTKWMETKEKLKEERRKLQREINELQQKASNAQELFVAKREGMEHLLKSIPASIRKKPAFDEALDRVEKRKQELFERFDQALKQKQISEKSVATAAATLQEVEYMHKGKQKQLEKERNVFLELMNQYQFKDYKQYESSKRSEAAIKHIQQEIMAYHEELRSVSDRRQELIQLLEGVEKPNVAHIKQELASITEQITIEQERWAMTSALIRDCHRIKERVEELNEDLKELEEKYQLIGHLYDMAHGNNVHKLTFERYVLASFLDDILTVANERLVKMTAGRYYLLRKTDRAKGNAQSGLELLVFDQYTGQERHVKTLSGGESFKASLALALGLAEVVQQYAGGVSLETMFIDEGFGTLDQESLDQAIEALMDIQSSGRLVGVISHVPELKERIEARLEVISTQSGSYTEFQFFG
ncbi:AAA family ATPase [Bacillus sp. FJAT-52991]|uniref:Nuclease SbcCD subunit C n=1 Tax=Bacillus kandeliae TaxID=3129297 RepID=A0ABZ2N9T2_9BACI